MSSKGSRRSACDARGTEFLAISMVTTWTPRRALFGELVLHNQASDRDRCWGGQGAGSTLCRSATGDEGPVWTVRPHQPISYGRNGTPAFPTLPARRPGGVGSAPSSGRALDLALQVAIVVVRERSHLERVGDRCRSTGIRLSQRNSTHMLGASPLTHEAQHSAAREQEVHHAAPNRRFSRMCRVSAEDFVPERGAQR